MFKLFRENWIVILVFLIGMLVVWLVTWGMTREKKDKDPYKGEW